ncbi:MAG TPA: PKD domain-containing protein [Gemmatimonadales bacterium]|nr:PKD domain-containing protein [Gemmatimonadales bacterium]
MSLQAEVAAAAGAEPTVFTDRATFLAQFPDLPLEDFEEGRVADGDVIGCPGPLDATSDNQCFRPGEIQPGVRFNSQLPAEGFEIALVGSGFGGALSKNIVAGTFTDVFVIDFTGGNVTAAGMDLVAYFNADVCQIDVFGQSGVIISTTAPCTNAGTFWGVSTTEIITQIRVLSLAGQAEGVDNISFGGGGVPPINHAPTANAAGPYSSAEGSPVLFDGSASLDPDGDQLSYDWDFGDGSPHDTGVNPSHTYADNRPGGYPVTLAVSDGGGLIGTANAIANIDNVAPAVGVITAPVEPLAVGESVTASASFTDPGTLDTHTGIIDWGDGTSSSAAVSEANGSGSASGSHAYTTAGVYTLTLTITDKDGGADQSVFEFVVVFDVVAGFVTGGGWINSPAGAYAANPLVTGKATFGFVSRYHKGATVPSGNLEFNFRVADLQFHSTSHEWLVVSGSKVRFKGSGTINGGGDFAFLVSAIDGDVNADGPDTFRIKIWDASTGIVVYDSEMGRGDGAPSTTVLAGGSIEIHN